MGLGIETDIADAQETFFGAQCNVAGSVGTHLFVISPNNSGSTFVTRALETCSDVWRLPREGQHMLGYEGPDLMADGKELIWAADPIYLASMRNPALYDWAKTRKAWYFQARASRPDARIFVTKAPPFLLTVDQLEKAFLNARFVFLVRDPYAVVEAICRYYGSRFESRETALKTAALHAVRCLQIQRDNVSTYAETGLFFSYEALCARPAETADQVKRLVPELSDLDFDQELPVKGRYHERLRNMNKGQIARLSREDLATINCEFAKHEALLASFDYGIRRQ